MIATIGYVWSQGLLGPALLAVAITAPSTFWYVARRRPTVDRAVLVGVTIASLAAIPGLALGRDGLPRLASAAGAVRWAPGGWHRFTGDFLASAEITLNMLLFVPAALLLTVVTRRPLVVVAGLIGLSVGVECAQGIFALGTADLSDVLANGVGAWGGSMAGLVVLAVAGRAERRMLATLAAFAAATAGAAACVPFAAQRHDDAVAAQLATRFAGSDLAAVRSWSTSEELQRRVFMLGDTFSDGASSTDEAYTVRYPTSFLGVRQCVYVVWSRRGVAVRTSSGAGCTVFMG